jgi:hypothetical protein
LSEIHFREAADLMDTAVPPKTEDIGPYPFPSGHVQDGVIIVEHRGSGPCILIGLFPQMKTEDRG